MNKNIILAGAVAIGIYLFSQGKAIFSAHPTQTMRQKVAERVPERRPVLPAIPMPKKVAQKRIGQPITQAAYIAAAQKKVRQEAAQKIGKIIGKKVAQKRIGQPITQAAYIAALRKAALRKAAARKAVAIGKAAVRKAAAQKIGKKIGKKVAQKVVPQISEETGGRTGMALVIYLQKKARAMHALVTQAANAVKNNSKIILPSSRWAGGRTGMALVIYLRRREEAIKRAVAQAKAAVPITRLFPGAERSRIIPYSESSRHSFYGPKSHKLQNEGYMVEWQKRHNNSIEAYNDRKLRYVLSHPEYWKK